MKKRAYFLMIVAMLLCVASCAKEEQNIKHKIKKAELGTVEYTVRQIIRNSDDSWSFFGDRKVLFSVKATLKAGIDLDKLSEEDIRVRGERIALTLPQPEIVALNIKPDDIKLAYAKVSALRSEYTQKEYDEILTAGEKSIRNDETLRANIIEDAKANAIEFFEILLRASGYTEIEIDFKGNN